MHWYSPSLACVVAAGAVGWLAAPSGETRTHEPIHDTHTHPADAAHQQMPTERFDSPINITLVPLGINLFRDGEQLDLAVDFENVSERSAYGKAGDFEVVFATELFDGRGYPVAGSRRYGTERVMVKQGGTESRALAPVRSDLPDGYYFVRLDAAWRASSDPARGTTLALLHFKIDSGLVEVISDEAYYLESPYQGVVSP